MYYYFWTTLYYISIRRFNWMEQLTFRKLITRDKRGDAVLCLVRRERERKRVCVWEGEGDDCQRAMMAPADDGSGEWRVRSVTGPHVLEPSPRFHDFSKPITVPFMYSISIISSTINWGYFPYSCVKILRNMRKVQRQCCCRHTICLDRTGSLELEVQ